MTPDQLVAQMEKVGRDKGATVSSPSITTRDGQRCVIEVGDPNVKPKSGYSVSVLPRFASEGIVLEILFKYTRPAAVEKKDGGLDATLATSVTVKDGNTILIGGTGTKEGRGMVLAVTASKIAAPPPASE